jgi:ribonuclease G
VAKEPLGRKGARITSHIALPGRYVVYMPTLDHVGVSRKIPSDEERQRLKRIISTHTKGLSGGFIVRTAGVGHSEEDFRQDIAFLVNLWADIKARSEKLSAPALLHRDLDLVLRTLRDQLSEEFTTIWVDNEQAYEQIVSLVQKFQPALVHRVRLYTKDTPLFEETGVQDEINRALKPKVWLKSGGYIVINQTEALVAIDVNTGKFVGKSDRLEDTIVKTNLEAIQEIGRQIRLRDLGGIIVIDFIDMEERKNRQKVMSALEEALHHDRAPSKILAFNEFGLVAITRKRVRQSLERTLCQPCAYCDGSGLVKSPATVCLEILGEARKMAPELESKQITLRVNPEVAKALKSRDNTVYAALEEITRKGVIIRSDPSVHAENFYFD